MSLQFAFVDFVRPLFLTLNGGFGDSLYPPVVEQVRWLLESGVPKPSRYELQ